MSSTISSTGFVSLAEGNAGPTAFSFTVTRTGDTTGSTSVNYAVAPYFSGSTVDAADFQGGVLPSGVLTFGSGETSKAITIFVQGDLTVEASEGFSLLLSSPTGGAVIGSNFANGTIRPDDGALIALSGGPSPTAEGNAGNTAFTFTATRSGDLSIAASATWSVSAPFGFPGTASAADFVGGALPTGTVSFAPNQTTTSFTIQVASDTVFEPNESFTVFLSNPSSGAVLETTGFGTTILNDDGAVISFADASQPSVTEGNSGSTSMVFDLVRTGDTSQAVSADWTVNSPGQGINPANAADFVGGVIPSGTVNFAAGQTTASVTLNIAGDTTAEQTEQLVLNLTTSSANTTIGTATRTGTVVNDDGAILSTTNTSGFSVNEGQAGSTPFSITITRSGDLGIAVSADWAVAAPAFVTTNVVTASDFLGGVFPSGTVSFGVGETSKIITVNLAGDTVIETSENFVVNLTNLSAGAVLGNSAFYSITNDDGAVISVTSTSGFATAEGNTGTTPFSVTFTRTGDLSIEASANWGVGTNSFFSQAQANAEDFAGGAFPSGIVTFGVGETSKVVTFNIAADAVFEPNESFVVNVTNPSAGATIGNTGFSFAITNDDGVVIAFASQPNPSVVEGSTGAGTPISFNVQRSGDTSVAASVNWAVSGFVGANAADFVGGVLPSGTLSFAIGETLKTITLNIAGDTAIEPNETISLSLSNPSANATIGSFSSISGTITNDDGAILSVTSGPLNTSEGNGGSTAYVLTVTRTGDLSIASSADWIIRPGFVGNGLAAADANDFVGGAFQSGTLSFAPGDTTRTITVNVAGDTQPEANETFFAEFSNVSAGTSLGSNNSYIIYDDDRATLSTTNNSGFNANEGNAGSTPFNITITRSGALNIEATANWAVVPATLPGSIAPNAADFLGGILPSGTVSFAAGETSKVITVNFAGDTVFEPNESFQISLTNLSAGAAVGTSATYSITNDDGVVIAFASQANPSVFEGPAGASTPMVFNVQRSGDASVTASVNWAVSSFSGATASDFVGGVLPTGTLSFAPGETLKTITLNIAGESAIEGNESISLQLTGTSSNATLGSFTSISGTITNDDPTSIAIAATDADKAEGNAGTTAYSFTVTRSGDVSGISSVNWAYSTAVTGTLATSTDFAGGVTPAGGTLTFAANETSKTITINVVGDASVETDERFAIVLSTPTNAILTSSTAFATIRNDDAPIDGTPASESLPGTAGDDVVRGLGGADSLDGAAGDDSLEGGDGADQLTGGLGADRFVLPVEGSARSTLSSMDVVLDFNEAQLDVLTFGGVNGTLTINGSNRTFIYNGDTGIFVEAAPALGQKLPAQFHNIPNYQAFWLQGVDALGAPAARGWLVVDVDGDELLGTSDFITEVRGALSGRDLNFPLYEFLSDAQRGTGLGAPSTFNSINDNVTGTGRNETFIGTTGNDTLNGGGAASNSISYSSFTTALSVTITGPTTATVVKSGGGGTDSLTNIYGVTTGSGNDSVNATALTVSPFYAGGVQTNGGNDTVTGGFAVQDDGSNFANIVVTYSGGTAAASINLDTGTASDGLGGTDTLINIRRLSLAGNFNDSVTGSAFNDQVTSSATGNRTIDLGAGTGDRWSMGTNSRDVAFGQPINRVEVELGTGTSGGEITGVARKYTFTAGVWTLTGTDALRGVEQANGSIGNDLLVGSDANNSFFGGEGDDSIQGGAGLDTIRNDSFMGNSSLPEHGITVNLTTGTAVDAWGFTDTLTSIENAYGTQQADDLTGVSIAGTRTMLRGLTGNDVLRATALDTQITADYRGDRGAVTVNLGTGLATDGWGDTDRLVNIQSVIGSRFSDSLTGGARNDLLEGGAGDDSLAGGAGTDIAIFTGALANYTITRNSVTNALTVADNTAGRDGADLVASDIETLRFSDGDVAAATFTAPATTFLAISALLSDQPEGNAGTTAFTFTVTRTGNTTGASSAAWNLTSPLSNGTDFQGGNLPSGTVSFAAGETTQTITVNVTGDTSPELDEGFTVTLASPTGAVILTASATGVIRNDEVLDGTPLADTLVGGGAAELIRGFAGTDSLVGNAGDDTIEGGDGFDTLNGGDGQDSLDGGTGDDLLVGGLGNDTLSGGGGSDGADYRNIGQAVTVTLNNTGAGTASTLTAGTDTLISIERILGSAFGDSITTAGNLPGGNNRVAGYGGNDTITGTVISTSVFGLPIADYLGTGGGAIVVNLKLGTANDGLGGTDTLVNIRGIRASAAADSITGSDFNDRIAGRAGNDMLDGGAGTFDMLDYSQSGAGVTVNMVTGTATDGEGGTDSFTNFEAVLATEFNDSILGTAGSNTFYTMRGNDTVIGNGGEDRVDFGVSQDFAPTQGIFVELPAGIATDGLGGSDSLVGITRITGTQFADEIYGGAEANRFNGRGGNDILDGGLGGDWAEYSSATTGVTVNLTTGTASDGEGGTDTLYSFESVIGSGFADDLTGRAQANSWTVLRGGRGNDTLRGFDDQFVVAEFADQVQGMTVNLGTGQVIDSVLGTDTLVNIRGAFFFGNFNDTVTGTAADEVFALSGGNDVLNAGGGRDIVTYGGSETNTLVVNLATGIVQDGDGGTDTLTGVEGVSAGYSNDVITGSAGDDVINPNAGTDVVDAGAGVDTLDYSLGFSDGGTQFTRNEAGDRALVQGMTINLATGVAVDFGGFTDTVLNFENAVGNIGADSIIGTGGDNRLTGAGGNDTLEGGGGTDTAVFSGLRSDYTITRNTTTGALTVMDLRSAAGLGTDMPGDGTDLLRADIEVLAFRDMNVLASSFATAAPVLSIAPLSADKAEGNAGTTAFTFTVTRTGDTTAASSANWAVSSASATTFDFSGPLFPSGTVAFLAGDVTKTITVSVIGDTDVEPDEAFTVTLSAPTGASLGTASANAVIRNDDIAVGPISGTAGNDTITPFQITAGVTGGQPGTGGDTINGLGGDDNLDGGAGNDFLDGGTGFDRLVGGDGNDTLIGGTGIDFFTPGAGDDSMLGGGDQGDVIIPTDATGPLTINISAGTMTGQGNDLFSGILNAHGSAFADSITGSSANQYMFGRGGADTLRGLGGDDNLFAGSGNDLLDGGDGSDNASYSDDGFDTAGVGTRGVIVNLSSSAVTSGADTVQAGTSVDNWGGRDTLIGIENTDGGGMADLLVGSDGNNNLSGSGGNDTIRGGSGNDFISGGSGDDSLDGGDGTGDGLDYGNPNDSAGAPTRGVIVNLSAATIISGADTVLAGTAIDSWGGRDTVSGMENATGSALDDLLVGDGSNSFISGRAGNDTLLGGGGNDVLRGGSGNDSLDGGEGTGDQAEYSGDFDQAGAPTRGVIVNLSGTTFTDGADSVLTGTAIDNWGGRDTLTGIENIGGSALGDILLGSDASNFMNASGGNDTLRGGAGNDFFNAGSGHDVVDGGDGTGDTMGYLANPDPLGAATRGVIVNLSEASITVVADTVTAGTAIDNWGGRDTLTGIENLTGSALGDVLVGNAVNNLLQGQDGDDSLTGGGGNDNLQGGTGNDVAVFSGPRSRYNATRDDVTGIVTVVDTQAGADGTDTVAADIETLRFSEGDVLRASIATPPPGIDGTDGPDTLTGGSIDNLIRGFAGNDSLLGNGGNDSIEGGDGNDTLDGGDGNDTLFGGSGSDFIRPGTGNDQVDGGEATSRNTISYSNLSGTISAVFTGDSTGSVTKSVGGTDSFVNINQINGTAGADNLNGSGVSGGALFTVNLRGSGGNDLITGNGTSRVVADYGDAGKAVNVNLGTGIVSQDGFDGQDTLVNVARVTASNGFNDTLTGGAANETFFVSSAGGNKLINGGAGTDTYRYGATTSISINLTLGTAVKAGGGTDTLALIESASGGGGNDSVAGDAVNNTLAGDVGNDTLDGRGGFDTADYTFFTNVTPTAGIVGSLLTGTVTDSWGNTDTLISIEGLTGTNFADDLTGKIITDTTTSGGSSDTQLRGLAGDDTLRAPENDTRVFADYRSAPGAVRINLSGTDAVLGGENVAARSGKDGYGTTDSFDKIQGVLGSNFNDVILGTERADRLWGLAGNDLLTGGAGDDTMGGGAGVDSYIGGAGFDLVTFAPYSTTSGEQPTQGAIASLATLTIANDGYGNAEVFAGGANDIEFLGGTAFGDDLTGARVNWLSIEGNSQVTQLRGGDGADTLRGVAGDERFISTHHATDTDANNDGFGVTVNLVTQRAIDGWGNTDTLVNIGAANGSAFADHLIGNDGENWFRGEGGNDTIEGGLGIDRVSYGNSTASVIADLAAGTVQDGMGGQDSLSDIEEVTGGTAGDTLRGDANDNRLAGLGGDDLLEGRGGNDTLIGDAGQDTAVFSGARARYTITRDATTGDLTVADRQAGGDGTDLVRATVETLRFTDGDFAATSFAGTILSITPLSAEKAEGSSGSTAFTFTVTRTGDAGGVSTVSWSSFAPAAPNTADASDFVGGWPGGTLTFAAGETSKIITVNVNADTALEADEIFTVGLASPTGATIGTGSASGVILNDDTGAVISVATGFNGVPEGNAGTRSIHFAVNRTGDTGAAVSASWAVSAPPGSGITGADFPGGTLPSGVVSFAAGETGKTITINVAGDTVVEENESFTLTLSAPTGGATLGTAMVNGTIINDDLPPLLDVSGPAGPINEGPSGTTPFTFTVTRTGDSSGVATAAWSVSGAANAADFAGGTLPSGTVTFGAGETVRTITIEVAGDNLVEPDEVFTLTLSAPTGATLGIATADATIRNDDSASVAPVLAIAPLSADKAEGNAGATPFTFTVTRTGDLGAASSAAWAVTGNGATAADFTGNALPSGTVSFAAGEASQTITVNVAGDTTNEANEGFTVTLSAPTGATLGTATAAGTIRNDDTSLFSITALSAEKAEGNAGPTPFTFTISREGNVGVAVGLTFTITGSGLNPATGADFNAGLLPSGTISFAANEVSRTLTVNILGDTLYEPAEGFTVTLSSANPVVAFATASAQGRITNDDPLTITGTAGPDTLPGTAEDELLLGLGDNDVLDGGAGNDTVDGGAGNDTLLAGTGTDSFNGGTGLDTLVFGPAFAGVNLTLSLASGSISLPGGVLSFANIESVTANSGNDVLIGDALANALNGAAGNDTLAGNLGNDSLTGGMGLDRFEVDAGTDAITDLGLGGAEILVVSAGATANAAIAAAWTATAASSVSGTANLTANGFNIDLTLASGAGLWTLTNAGNATGLRFTGSLSADSLTGGEGGDTLLGGNGGDTLLGNGGTDSLSGGLGNDSLNGGAGNDTLLGEADDDSLTGGAGDDRLTGGAGADRFGVDAGTDTITDLGLGGADVVVVSAGATVNATLVANWILTAGNSQSGAANITAAGFNADLTLAAGSAGWAVSNLGTNRAVAITGSARNDTLTGGNGNDTVNGGGGNDSLSGDAGSDSLTGGTGNDSMTGGAGVDRFVVDAGTDTIMDLASGGNDLLIVSAGAIANATLAGAWTASSNVANAGQVNITAGGFGVNLSAATGAASGLWSVTNAGQAAAVTLIGSGLRDRLTGGLGQDSLSGGLGDDTLTGGEARDTLSGGAGVDSLVGGAGDDLLTGGADLDRFLVEAGTDTITDLGFGGTDALIIQAGATANATIGGHWTASAGSNNAGSANLVAAGFNVDLAATSGASGWALTNAGHARGIAMTGSANADTITGGNGADTMRGGAGADSLNGSAGNDQLFGGAGNDTMTGGAGIDRFAVDSGTDVITDLAAGGVDILIISAGATAQATLVADWVATSASSNVGIAQLTAGGFDVNLSAVLGTAGWNVSNAGDANAVVFTGSARADVLTGGSGADTLIGGAGNDTIIGGGGLDSLLGGLGDDRFMDAAGAQIYEGGAGRDRYSFLTGHGNDSIRDFVQGQDKIDFAGFGGVTFASLQITYGGAGTPSDPAYVVVSANGGVDSVSISLAAPTTLLNTDFIFV